MKASEARRVSGSVIRALLVLAGTLFLALGIIGMFLPVLPTTPFLLLAAACYIRGSSRMYCWLINNKWFGRYIRSYREGNGLPLRVKVTAIGLLWLTIGFSLVFMVPLLVVKILLFAVAVGVTLYLHSLPTAKESKDVRSS